MPFFDSSEASATSFQALQPGRRASKPVAVPAHGLKRVERSSGHLAGSPPKKEAEVLQARHQRRAPRPATSGSSASSGAASDTEMSSPVPQQRKPRGQGKKGKAAPAAGAQRASPTRRRADPVADLAALSAASVAAGAALRSPAGRAPSGAKAAPVPYKFAGPAFTNSPTPDCLPIPTSSLLLQVRAAGVAGTADRLPAGSPCFACLCWGLPLSLKLQPALQHTPAGSAWQKPGMVWPLPSLCLCCCAHPCLPPLIPTPQEAADGLRSRLTL